MYKNKLVIEIDKEIKKETEAKMLEEKKQKIRKMLAIIENKENNIAKKLEEVEIEKKQTVALKEQLEKEDFSILTDAWLGCPYGYIIGLSLDTTNGMSCSVSSSDTKY